MNQTPKQNEKKINKMLYIVTVTLLFAIAVVIALTATAGKRNNTIDPPPLGSDSQSESDKEPLVTAPITTDNGRDTREPTDAGKTKDTDAVETEDIPAQPVTVNPPDMSLPAVGFLSKAHDPSMQVYSATMNDYRTHTGIDIVTEAGAPVYAAAEGVVSQIWDDPLMGKCVAISHSGDCYTIYKNLSVELTEGIAEGVSVTRGQLIAAVGESAMIEIAEEPHLHFEITVDGKAEDPLDYFNESALVSLTIDASYES